MEVKRHLAKAFPLSKYVTLDLERCIQCGRCVRFTEEISGDSQLAFMFRSAQMTPQTFELTDFDSKFSGNTIEICPVGALTSAKFRFRARPWDLETRPAICTECSNGCATWFDFRVDQMVRINGRTNEAVNEEWTCDRGKFGHEWLNSPERLSKVLIRDGEKLRESSWSEAYEALLPHFKDGGSAVAGLCGGRPSNEDLFLFKKTFNEVFGSNNIDSRWYANAPEAEGERRATAIASLEEASSIVVFGGNLAEEQPIVYLRVRKAWFKRGAKVLVASPLRQEADGFADRVIRYAPGDEERAIQELKRELSGDVVVLASRTVYDLPNAKAVVKALDSLGGVVNILATEANEQGALDIGVIPSAGALNTRGILEACRDGRVKALWLLQCDPFARWHDRELVSQALSNVEFLVVQDVSRTEAFDYASVVLPMCAFAERDGSYTNCEHRVQYVPLIMAPKGSAKSGWKVFGELMMRASGAMPPFSAKEVFAMLAEEVPAFAGVSLEAMPASGVPLEALVESGARAYAARGPVG